MRAGIVFFKLQCKKYSKILPVILAESLLFAFLVILLGAAALKMLGQESSLSRIEVAVVSEEEEKLTELIIGFVGAMESFEGNVTFLQMEEEEAYEALEKGEIYAAVILPKGVLEGILNGTNIPARVILSRAGGEMETAIFEEVAQAGGRMLSVAQAGIYAADDFCLVTGHSDKISETEDYLNEAYLEYALNRNAIFKQEQVSATGKVNLLLYYGTALLLVFLTFAGIVMGKFVQVYPTALSSVLAASGLKLAWQYLLDAVAFASVFSLAGGIIGCPVLFLCTSKTGMESVGVVLCVVLVLVLFVMSVFIRMLFEITGNESGGLGCVFLVVFAMMFACGLFLPSAFLPLWVDKVGQILPYHFWLTLLLDTVQNGVEVGEIGMLLSGCLFSLFVGAGLFLFRSICIGREAGEK